MTKWIETTGRTEEDAISAALFQLGLDRDDVSVEVIERAKSGFLGFGSSPAKVRVSYEDPDVQENAAPAPTAEGQPAPAVEEKIILAAPKAQPKKIVEKKTETRLKPGDEVIIAKEKAVETAPAAEDDAKAARIREFLDGLMEHMGVQATPSIQVTEEGNYKVVLQGEGLGAIIGRRGETLDAIQQLTNYAVNSGSEKRIRVHVDAENYRAKREQSLEALAAKVAAKVTKYRRSVTLEPMNAYERHVIHSALQEVAGVTTYSIGTEPNRRVVVAYDRDKR